MGKLVVRKVGVCQTETQGLRFKCLKEFNGHKSVALNPNDIFAFFLIFNLLIPTGSECDDEDVEFEASDSDESWTTESAISSDSILSSMCMNGGDEKPFACPVPGCKKRYKVCFIHLLSRLEAAF